MLVICEGPDGSGKSTLVAQLQAVIERRHPGEKVEVLHRGPPAPGAHPLDEYELPLLSYRPRTGHHIICDRWSWGEWVYPDVLGRKTLADRATWYHIELFLQSRGAVIVYLNESVGILEERLRTRGDDLIKPEQLGKISARYDMLVTSTLNPTWQIIPHPERVVMHARQVERDAARLNPYVTYVGPQMPDYVLVGDVRHDIHEGDLRPAFMPYNATSGHFLLSHIRAHDLTNVGLINACDVDDVEQFMDEHIHYDVEYVALGRNAYDKLKSLGAQPRGVPHPQYVRRFQHQHGAAYAEAIQRTAFNEEDNISWRP